MPNQDKYHEVVLQSLVKSNWTIVKEQEFISVGRNHETNRRLYIDIKAKHDSEILVLIEIKSLERSPVHELMELLGQYLI